MFCSDIRGEHKSFKKIQLSIVSNDLIVMVTKQKKILITPAFEENRDTQKVIQSLGNNNASTSECNLIRPKTAVGAPRAGGTWASLC